MKLKYKITSILICSALLMGQSFAATQEQLSVKQATDAAVQNSASLKLFDDKIALAEKELKQVNVNAEYIKTVTTYEKDEYVSNRKAYQLTPLKKLNSVNDLKRQKIEKVNSIVLDVMTQYYDISSKLDQLSDAKRSLETLNKEMDAKKSALALGKITQLSYNSYEIKKVELENALKKAEVDLEVSYMKFANATGKPTGYKFTPADNINEVKEYVVNDLRAVIENEKLFNRNLLNKQASVEELSLEVKINTESQYQMGSIDSPTTLLQNELKSAEQDLKDANLSLDMNLRIDAYKLQSTYDTVALSKANLSLAQKEFEVAKVKYGVGTISLIEYLAKQEAFDKAETGYRNSLTGYVLAVEKFKMDHFAK